MRPALSIRSVRDFALTALIAFTATACPAGPPPVDAAADGARDGALDSTGGDAAEDVDTAVNAEVPPFDQVVRACLMTEFCDQPTEWLWFEGFQPCVDAIRAEISTGLTLQRRRDIECFGAAANCAEAARCFPAVPPDYCGARAQRGYCQGTVPITCGTVNRPWVTEDCTQWGERCVANALGAACGDGRTCDGSMPPRCDGNRLVTCGLEPDNYRYGIESSVDCARLYAGGLCATESNTYGTYGRCVPPGPACTTRGSRCEGSVRVACYPEAGELRVDCAAVGGGACQIDSTGAAACVVPQGTECTDGTRPECSGTESIMCLDGRLQRYDCTSFGLPGCDSFYGSC